MRDIVLSTARQKITAWRSEAFARLQRSQLDGGAQVLNSCALELEKALDEVDDQTKLLTVEQYAKEFNHVPSTVRRWCLRGELPAERNLAKDWEIQRNARRVKRTTTRQKAG
jgi:hypothetical protein